MKRVRIRAVLLAVSLLFAALPLSSCARPALYTATFLDTFDTALTVQAVSADRAEAENAIREVHTLVLELHRQFDIYHEWSGVTGLWTVNDSAGDGEPVPVSRDVIDLLTLGRTAYELSGGMVNVCLGAVLSLWHDARLDGTYVPDTGTLQEAARHTSIDSLVIDEADSTVRLTDPGCSLDVGAIAKGYVTARVRDLLAPRLEDGRLTGFLFDLGGNVLALGTPPDKAAWAVAVRDPLTGGTLVTHYVSDTAVVTSGVDQRAFTVGGETYHHLIDPGTLMPGDKWLSVTVFVPAGYDVEYPDELAFSDALSTTLFLMTREEGEALMSRVGRGISALWVLPDGSTAVN
ncbi:MAG: FAD:protein FMN transferase [Clostridia bacterium]|nr:FAD:protein FMN transferase [Clostridia bacterium]